MKKIFYLFATVLLMTFTSCFKDDDGQSDLDCSHLETSMVLKPFCSFNPSSNRDVQFPIAVWYNNDPIHLDGFTFLWDNGNTSSAISVSYNTLPVTVEVTEEATGCVIELTITQNMWG